jgi:activator of HSP90 ATPase
MTTDTILLEDRFPIHPDLVFTAWLDNMEHSAFTGSEAKIEAKPGGKFSALDQYITGKTLEFDPGERILQTWRTRDFPEDHPDSTLEIRLKEIPEGCLFQIIHTGIPLGTEAECRKGWIEYYLKPMREYFK